MANTTLLESFYELQENIFISAKDKEEKYNSYYHNMTITNSKAKNSYNIDYSNHKYFSDFANITMQKVLYNKTMAKNNDNYKVATFFTISLPTQYHYFITTKKQYNPKIKKYETIRLDFEKWKVNPKYAFNTMEEGIEAGYKALSVFWRTFYNKIKVGSRKYKKLAKEIRYDVVNEFHKSLQIHSHGIIYSNVALLQYIKKCFKDTIKELEFDYKGCDLKQDFDNLDGASQYILKYISKNLYSDAEQESHFTEVEKKSHSDFMVGWKLLLGKYTRIHKSSNTKLGIENYKKIYHNLSKEDKELLITTAKENNTCLLYEIEQSTYKETSTVDRNTGEVKTKYLNQDLQFPMFQIFIDRDKEKLSNQERINNLLHSQSVYKKNNALNSIIKEIETTLINIKSYRYKYTTHSFIIKDKSRELYNKAWFSAIYQSNKEKTLQAIEQLDETILNDSTLYTDILNETQKNCII